MSLRGKLYCLFCLPEPNLIGEVVFTRPQVMLEHESVVAPQGIPLQAQVEELRRRAQTIARLQGGDTYYLEEVRIYREYIEEHRLPLARSKASLNLPPDEEGNEHQVLVPSGRE